MSNRNLLTIIIVLLLGVIAVVVMRQPTQSNASGVGDQISEGLEEVADEIDDHT